jgi:hypothetical protein
MIKLPGGHPDVTFLRVAGSRLEKGIFLLFEVKLCWEEGWLSSSAETLIAAVCRLIAPTRSQICL